MNKESVDKEIFTKILDEKDEPDIYSNETDLSDDEIDRKINRYYSENADEKELMMETMLSQERVMNRIIKEKRPRKMSKIIKACVSVAAAFCILLVGNQSIAAATDYNFFDEIVRLGRYVIESNSKNVHQNSAAKDNITLYDQMRGKCRALGFSPLLPRNIPQNMQIKSIKKDNDGAVLINLAAGSDSVMEIEIRKYDAKHQKQDIQIPGGENPQIERKGNLIFYIADSNSWEYGIFADAEYTYVVNASVTRDELIKVLLSFEK